MFTVGACILVAIVGWYAVQDNGRERKIYDSSNMEDRDFMIALHTRQDIKLVAYLLGAILVALGVIADRIH